jgi:flagellar biogenesis protein FliO
MLKKYFFILIFGLWAFINPVGLNAQINPVFNNNDFLNPAEISSENLFQTEGVPRSQLLKENNKNISIYFYLFLFIFLTTLSGIFFVGYLNYKKRKLFRSSVKNFKLLETYNLKSKLNIHILKLADELLIIGENNKQFNFIHEIKNSESKNKILLNAKNKGLDTELEFSQYLQNFIENKNSDKD